jgi:hypothetical protein
VKTAQDEASPAALRRKTQEAYNHRLAEHEGVLGRYFPELTESAENSPTAACGIGPSPLRLFYFCSRFSQTRYLSLPNEFRRN